jgi:hypothetical protein
MIAMTTKSSISVKPLDRERKGLRDMGISWKVGARRDALPPEDEAGERNDSRGDGA